MSNQLQEPKKSDMLPFEGFQRGDMAENLQDKPQPDTVAGFSVLAGSPFDVLARGDMEFDVLSRGDMETKHQKETSKLGAGADIKAKPAGCVFGLSVLAQACADMEERATSGDTISVPRHDLEVEHMYLMQRVQYIRHLLGWKPFPTGKQLRRMKQG